MDIVSLGTNVRVRRWGSVDKIVVGTPRNWTVGGFASAAEDSEDKVGFEAIAKDASFVIEHINRLARRAIRRITVVCMHSYGPKWQNSRLQVVVQKQTQDDRSIETLLNTTDLIGFHRSRTSIYVPYELDLKTNETSPGIEPGETLRIEFRLIAGATFKILGLTFCAD